MSTLRRQEPAGPGLKRIACAQVESAIRCLTRQAGQGVAAGQAIDQTKAVLALVEPDLPRPMVRRDRAILDRLSDGLTTLSEPVLLADLLGKRYKKNPTDSALASAVKTLRKRWAAGGKSGSAMSNKAGSFNPAIYRLVADMAELRGHLGDWPVDAVPSDLPPRGLRRTYTRARKLVNEPITASALPDLIRALTELTTQLSVISKACPSMVKAQRKLITRSVDELNDLVLNDKLDAALRAELGKGAAKALPSKKPMAQRASACLASDLDHALAETPAALMKRMQAYWDVWRDSKSA
jgi:hypothetical protein